MTGTHGTLRVVIADDHPLYRHGLADLLRRDGIVVAAEVPNGEAAIAAAVQSEPDVVVMDLNMPGLSGLDATRRLAAEAPAIRVLVLTVSAQDEDVADALRAGAIGYILKDAPVEDIVAAVRAAATGHAPVSGRIEALPADRAPAGPAQQRPGRRFGVRRRRG
jgi:DNA-binding NarL/FixJ family response regulator